VKKILKWLGFVVLSAVVLLVLALTYLFAASERELAIKYKVSETLSVPPPTDPAEIAEGQRLARLTGCIHCHSENLSGAVPLDIPGVARFVAPNVTTVAPQYSDAEFVGLLRRGVRRDGKSVWFMPSEMFRNLHDEDLARVIAWVRSMPQSPGVTEKTRIRLVGRFIVVAGKFKSAARQIDELIAAAPVAPLGRGGYLVMNLCSECHGQDLNGREDAKAPPLAVAKGYSLEQFARLMHEGIGTGDRQFELMTPTSKARFSALTPEEVKAIFEFLQAR